MHISEEIPVFRGPHCCGFVFEDEARQMISAGEVRLIRKDRHGIIDRRLVLLSSDGLKKVRSVSGASAGLRTTQREELYSGSRKQHTEGPVTATITVLRRNVGGSFRAWSETDKFPRRRFNPDKPATPLFRSIEQARRTTTNA
jgi:hypothetical protein